MITALDSSVLWAIIKKESGHKNWIQALIRAAGEGPLVISPVAFAELSPSTPSADALMEFLGRLAISYDPIPRIRKNVKTAPRSLSSAAELAHAATTNPRFGACPIPAKGPCLVHAPI